MKNSPTVKIDPDDVARYLLYQQFYYGGDHIYGRTKDRSEAIDGAGEAIEKFYLLITKKVNLIDEGHILRYLEYFNENLHEVPIDAIMNKFNEAQKDLGPDLHRNIAHTIIVGDCLTEIQDKSFRKSIHDLIDFILKKRSLKSDQREEIYKKIKFLYGSSSPNIGMIYGLSFMKFISMKVGNKKIENECHQLLDKYFDLVAEEIEKFKLKNGD